jgi:DNA-binding MarR family transcriptional regulator
MDFIEASMKLDEIAQDERKRSKVEPNPVAERFRFGFLVHDVSRLRRTFIDQEMRPHGITRSQWSVLSALSRSGNDGMMQVDLARLLELGKVTIGGLVDRLEATGHVERRPDKVDRRAKRVFVTELGFKTIARMIEVAAGLNARILEGVTKEELIITERTLMLVKGNIKDALVEERDEQPEVVPAKKVRKQIT